ncbi:MAG: TatD family hydrolase [bacterium]
MIDTHCHLIDPQFNRDIIEVINRARSAGINKIINVGYDKETSVRALKMNEEYDWILPAIGIHPNESADESISEMAEIEILCNNTKVVAVGETGLDFYRNFYPREAQQILFRQHINIARKYKLPLIIHTRMSIDEAIKILSEEDYHRGLFHCFSGTLVQAKKVMALGFYLGFGGTLTFSKNVREVFQYIPLDFVVFETDAPFLTPAGHKGKRNEPSFIFETLNVAASIKAMNPKEVEMITDRNAEKLFCHKE